MTYFVEDGGQEVVPELRFRIVGDGENGDYLKLRHSSDDSGEGSSAPTKKWYLGYWVRFFLLLGILVVLAGVIVKWVRPFIMDKEIIPLINWETKTFSLPVLAVIVFASISVFPVLILPSSPSMWVAGMTFGYGFGFLLIISGAAVGVSLPYFIGSHFYHRIQAWLEKYPKKASILRCAGEGNWFHQFRAVALIRISPFPYIIYNYCAVATNVKYGPYFLGSLVGMVPEIFVTMYTGILIRKLADASHERRSHSVAEIVFNAIGFLLTAAATIFITMYAKRKLTELQQEDQPPLQLEESDSCF